MKLIIMDILENVINESHFNALNKLDLSKLVSALKYAQENVGFDNDFVFVDVGTNAGSFIEAAYHNGLLDGQIHCFEPHPQLAKIVKEKYPKIKMNNFCLSNKSESIPMFFPKANPALSSFYNRPVFKMLGTEIYKIDVKCETLTEYCLRENLNSIDFIKIDTEGAEHPILNGAIELLKAGKIKCGFFELGSGECYRDANFRYEDTIALLTATGYKIDCKIEGDVFFSKCT